MRLALKLPSVSNVYLGRAFSPCFFCQNWRPCLATWPPPSLTLPLWVCLFWFNTARGAGTQAHKHTPARTHTHTQRHALGDATVKGIRDISMCDELPKITPAPCFHDIVAALPHYHNVTAVVWGCCVWGGRGQGAQLQVSGLWRWAD